VSYETGIIKIRQISIGDAVMWLPTHLIISIRYNNVYIPECTFKKPAIIMIKGWCNEISIGYDCFRQKACIQDFCFQLKLKLFNYLRKMIQAYMIYIVYCELKNEMHVFAICSFR